ncbi:MAG: hypothetical protein HRU19_08585 [Pseudobacteriovorax sp.]|nr:hypothetical protein [Pseudobacteriovorax sp.]
MIILSFAFCGSAGWANKIDTKLYSKKLQRTMAFIDIQKPLNEISKEAVDMVDMSIPILEAFKNVEMDCKVYIDEVLKVASKLSQMPLSKIENDYHADKALPKASPICHHAKDLLVHPATVIALGKASQGVADKAVYAKMRAELVELSTHLAVVEKALTGKK